MKDRFKFDDEFEKKNKGEFHIPKDWRLQLANTPDWIREYYKQLITEKIFKELDQLIQDLKRVIFLYEKIKSKGGKLCQLNKV